MFCNISRATGRPRGQYAGYARYGQRAVRAVRAVRAGGRAVRAVRAGGPAGGTGGTDGRAEKCLGWEYVYVTLYYIYIYASVYIIVHKQLFLWFCPFLADSVY